MPAEQQVAISITGLVKYYGTVQALRGVDLQVSQGAIFGFLGPNGAGKTTTIRCMLDLIRPNSGSIAVFGINPQRRSVQVRSLVGYLPGELALDESLTGLQSLRLISAMRGNRTHWPYVYQLAQRLQLDLHTRIRNLSKGNKQKVGILMALMDRPPLLILDEPTLGLDPLMQHEVLSILTEVNQEGCTVFFSSHIMSEVEQIAQQVAIIRSGRVVEVASVQQLLQRSLRRVQVRFTQPIDPAPLQAIPGVSILHSHKGLEFALQVAGDMAPLVRVLANLPLRDLETERPTLEEVFLTYYGPSQEEPKP